MLAASVPVNCANIYAAKKPITDKENKMRELISKAIANIKPVIKLFWNKMELRERR
ncbi:hypothetical protein MASR2M117_22050 [Paludibacter sp.]